MGSTFADSAEKFGDFDDWVLRCMPESYRPQVWVGRKDTPLPDPKTLKGLIITGSHSMVTRTTAWERKAMHWVRWAMDEGVPTLGICYGHQMIAHILGGVVGYLPDGPELGYQRLHFHGEYESDPLFGLYPSHFEAFTFHYQSVLRLPHRAKALARSPRERNHAVRYDDWVWGVQYHPEFSPSVSAEYLVHESLEVERAGLDLRALLRESEQERPSDPLIPRFLDLALSRSA